MSNTVNDSAIKKLKLLITVVDRNKGEFYLDVLSQFEVNFQTLINGTGTANSEILDMLGLNNNKAVVLSVIREDLTDNIMKLLSDDTLGTEDMSLTRELARKAASSKARYPLDYTITRAIKQYRVV